MQLVAAAPPSRADVTGKVMTVLGPVEPQRLGRTLVREHLFIDLRHCSHVSPPPELASLANARASELDVEPWMGQRTTCIVPSAWFNLGGLNCRDVGWTYRSDMSGPPGTALWLRRPSTAGSTSGCRS